MPDHRALVQVAVDLLVHRLHDRGQRVADVRAADAPGEVDVLAAVDVPDPAPSARSTKIGGVESPRAT